MNVCTITLAAAVALAATALPCCEAECADASHWDAWDAAMGTTTPADKRLPYGTVCEALWADDVAHMACKFDPNFEQGHDSIEKQEGNVL